MGTDKNIKLHIVTDIKTKQKGGTTLIHANQLIIPTSSS